VAVHLPALVKFLSKWNYLLIGEVTEMPNGKHKHPQYALRIAEATMDKLKYVAGHNGRSANKEIELLILRHIAEYEAEHGKIELSEEDYEFICKRNQPRKPKQ